MYIFYVSGIPMEDGEGGVYVSVRIRGGVVIMSEGVLVWFKMC